MIRRVQAWLGLIVVATASCVVSMALLELLLRAVPGLSASSAVTPRPTPGVFHPYVGHLHTPHSRVVVERQDFRVVHDTDGHGFRNSWPWPERAEIVAVGDSLTFGYGVTAAEAWPAVLARALPGVGLINLGLIGASTPQYRRVYDLFGAALRPRVLLIGVFPRNDFWDAGLFDLWLGSGVGENYMVWRDGSRRSAQVPGRQPTESFARQVGAVVQKSRVVRLIRHASDWYIQARYTYKFPDGSVVRLRPDDLAAKTMGSEAGQREYQVLYTALVQLHRQARQDGTRALVVLLPSKEEVHLPLLGVPFRDPARDLRQALHHDDIDHVDLVPLFRARAAAGQRLFFEEDGHPNTQGYALIAEGVLGHLRAHHQLNGALERQMRPGASR